MIQRLLVSTLSLVLIVLLLRSMSVFDRFIFFPDSELVGTPSSVGLAYEEAEFAAADGVPLHGWYVPGVRTETVLWFHGNAGNISHRLHNLRLLHDRVGAGVFLFDYRQYGRSGGVASEAGLYADARGALRYLQSRRDVSDEDIIYFGRSLGSAVALDLATDHLPRGLILETPFTSVREMARTILPGPLAYVAPGSFDNLSKIAMIRCPTLFVHGDRDEIVPYEQGRSVFDAAAPPKAFYTVRGAGHNDTYLLGGETYFRRIREFIDGLRNTDHS